MEGAGKKLKGHLDMDDSVVTTTVGGGVRGPNGNGKNATEK